MYDQSDPRASLAPAAAGKAPPPGGYAPSSYARFYETPPQESGPEGDTWYARGQNFVVAYTAARDGARFERRGQPDEYVLILPDAATAAVVTAGGERMDCAGDALVSEPDGALAVDAAGRIAFAGAWSDLPASLVRDEVVLTEAYLLLKQQAYARTLILEQQRQSTADLVAQQAREREATGLRRQQFLTRQADLAAVRKDVAEALAKQAEVEAELFTLQKQVGDTLRLNFGLEDQLQKAEYRALGK